MIESIEIGNFRGIKNLLIQGFGDFNIFVGGNSCGKTSILEAIATCYGADEVQSLVRIQNFRHTIVFPSNLTSLFYNFDFLTPIEIASEFDSQKVQTYIHPTTNHEAFYPQEELKHTPLSMLEQKINGLSFLRIYDNQECKTSFSVQNDGNIQYSTPSKTSFPLLAFFLPSDIEQWGLAYFVNIVRKEKKKDEFVEHLRFFDERVRDIEVQENSVLIDIEGISKLVNINFLGEGFKKYTTILALMLVAKQWHTRFCVCIDEIENGLHFSSVEKLLSSILKLSKQIDFQFFFSTHSLEFLDIARKVLGERSKIFKVASTKSGIKTYPYSQEGDAYFTLDRIDPRGGQ